MDPVLNKAMHILSAELTYCAPQAHQHHYGWSSWSLYFLSKSSVMIRLFQEPLGET